MRAVCLVLSSRRVLRGSIFRSVLMILVVCLHKARSNKIKTYITSCLICVWYTSWFFLVFYAWRMLVRVREGLSLKGDRYRGDLWDTQLCEYGRSFRLRKITIQRALLQVVDINQFCNTNLYRFSQGNFISQNGIQISQEMILILTTHLHPSSYCLLLSSFPCFKIILDYNQTEINHF